MNHFSMIATLLSTTLLVASPSAANLISNGDFETLGGEAFQDWSTGYTSLDWISSDSVISDSYSIEVLKTKAVHQTPSSMISDFVLELDFAAFAVPTGGRSFHMMLGNGYVVGADQALQFRVTSGGAFQAYDGESSTPSWTNLGSLSALLTTDDGNNGKWEGETPVINHLKIDGHINSGSVAPVYDITLNDTTVTNVNFVQYLGVNNLEAVTSLYFAAFASSSNYLVDNVSLYAPPQRIPGDANEDQYVNAQDAAILAENWLTLSVADWSMGDFNGDNKVDDIDATLMASNWGRTPVNASAVPEPSSFVLILIVCLSCVMIRYRH